jgi:hypothetical protein
MKDQMNIGFAALNPEQAGLRADYEDFVMDVK